QQRQQPSSASSSGKRTGAGKPASVPAAAQSAGPVASSSAAEKDDVLFAFLHSPQFAHGMSLPFANSASSVSGSNGGWIDIATTRVYRPGAADVGHRLRL